MKRLMQVVVVLFLLVIPFSSCGNKINGTDVLIAGKVVSFGMNSGEIVTLLGEPSNIDAGEGITVMTYENVSIWNNPVDELKLTVNTSTLSGGNNQIGLVKVNASIEGIESDKVEKSIEKYYGKMQRDTSPNYMTDIVKLDEDYYAFYLLDDDLKIDKLSEKEQKNIIDTCKDLGISVPNTSIHTASIFMYGSDKSGAIGANIVVDGELAALNKATK